MKRIALSISTAVISVMILTNCGGSSSNEVTIDSQVWMTKNLNVDTFRNGEAIPQARTNEEWLEADRYQKPAWCYYKNDPSNGEKYGKLYNWYAVNDWRGLAPSGWSIPNAKDFGYLSDQSRKRIGLMDIAAGSRSSVNGGFSDIDFSGNWWTKGEEGPNKAKIFIIDRGSFFFVHDKGWGASVRCLKETINP